MSDTAARAREQRIAEIREREKKAAKGPLVAGLDLPFVDNNNPDKRIVWSNSLMVADFRSVWIKQEQSEANAEFYAHARADIPFLLEQLAAQSAAPVPDKAMLKAIAEDGLLVTWDKDYKFNFSQVVRLMVEFAMEHHQEAQAIGNAASPAGRAEPPPQGYCPSEHPSLKVGCSLRPGHEGKHENMGDTWVAAEPSAWPSDLPADGMGAMNLITNFWTGDLKGLTKEGARIVDSLVAHVTKGIRAELETAQRYGRTEYGIEQELRKDLESLREQLEQAQSIDVEINKHHSALIGKIQAVVDKAFPDDRWAEYDVLNQGVAKIFERAEAAEAQLATVGKRENDLRCIGGSLRMNLKDAATLYPEHFNAESLKQLITEWDEANRASVAALAG